MCFIGQQDVNALPLTLHSQVTKIPCIDVNWCDWLRRIESRAKRFLEQTLYKEIT